MKHVVRNLSIISCSLLLLSGCISDSPFKSLFGQDAENEYSKNHLPTLGSTNFEPIQVSKVGNTGTLVGQKVIAYRNELTELQASIKQNNSELQKVRTSVINNAIEYHNTTAAMEAKLQLGTTPGNPIMYSMLEKTQNNVVVMDENANVLNKIYNQAVSDMSVVNNLLDSIRATYAVSGAIDEDHAQLRTLENETSQTAILINSLISEVGSDYSRQIEYTSTARNYLASLDRAIKVGSYGVSNTPIIERDPSQMKIQPLPLRAPVASNIPNKVQPSDLNGNVNGKPLFAVKFNQDNVNYKDSLHRTIKAAKNKNKNFHYEIIAVSPINASSNTKTLAQTKAATIFQDIVSQGINPDNIYLLSRDSDNASSAEVQIFVK